MLGFASVCGDVGQSAGFRVEPGCVGELLEQLLEHGCESAKKLAASHIPSPLPTDDEGKARAITAALALLDHCVDGGWDIVWPAIVSGR